MNKIFFNLIGPDNKLYNISYNTNPTKLTKKIIKDIYKDMEKDVRNVTVKEDHSYTTYGEIDPTSVDIIINKLKIDNNDIFYDLGSGSGKVVMQFYTNTNIKKAIGIELQTNRHDISIKAFNKLKTNYKNLLDPNRELIYYNQNMYNSNIDDATIVFMCSTCYGTDLLDIVYDKLKNNKKLKYIISLKSYDRYKDILPQKMSFKMKTSWNETSPCNIYYN